MRGEAELIRELQRRFRAGGGVRVGVGDDAAVLCGDSKSDWVVTTDLLIEGVHFLRTTQEAPAVGWKALARSLSDMAAMGARPRYALVALAVPPSLPPGWVKAFFSGLGRLARRHRVKVAGGDLSSAPQIVVDVQVLGEVGKGAAILRRGARPGDALFVSGTLGLSGLGLACVREGVASSRALLKRAVRAHLLPQPRLHLAQALARRGVTSMIDLSDGLSTDLGHVCAASRVGARVYAEQIPVVKLTPRIQRRLKARGLELALNAGEDYELLFTLPKKQAGRLPKKLAGVKVTSIGEITRTKKILLVDASGARQPLRPRGWDHFRRRPGAR
jgi:thiamine-monophosphate kinase